MSRVVKGRPRSDGRSKVKGQKVSSSQPFGDASETGRSKVFPEVSTIDGFLDVRHSRSKDWKRRYFLLNNNFLLMAATPRAATLDKAFPMESASVRAPTDDPLCFEVKFKRVKLYFKTSAPKLTQNWYTSLKKASHLKIKDIYRFLYTLGTSESQNTKVVAAKHRTSGKESAIKIVDKRLCDQRMLRNEIGILKTLKSPYLVKMFDLFETKKYLYLIMEKCEGGELFDQIAALDGDHYSEASCCNVMYQIASGVAHMHEHDIVHRDLKPENVLCMKPHSIDIIKLADFGISKHVRRDDVTTTMVGTLSYTAPEVLAAVRYGREVDYWSVGVIMYILLCGYPPFYGDDDSEIQRAILRDEVEFEDEDWEHVSEPIMNLVKGLLKKNPRERKSVDAVMKATWKVKVKTDHSFKGAHTKFKDTLEKRKRMRASMSVFEETSGLMKRLYGGRPEDMTPAARISSAKRASKTADSLAPRLSARSSTRLPDVAEADDEQAED